MVGDSSHSTALQPGTVLGGRYRLERVLGRGGMGAVFEATAPDGTRVAIKAFFRVFSPTDTGGDRARFQREAAVSQSLRSDNIVRVTDHGFDPPTGTPFIVMDLMEGEDLEGAIDRVGPLDPRVASTILLRACRGLEVAHAAGVIHRDVKPSNIFLQELPGGALGVKLCDFGVAKVLDQGESLTATGSVLGSPLFMAPEQFVSSRRVDERSDVWAVAMSLYHALTGHPAFYQVQTFAQLVVAVSEGKVPSVQTVAPWVSPELAAVVHGGLIVDLSKRCPSIREFATALETAAPPFPELTRALIAPIEDERRRFVADIKPLLSHWRTMQSAPGEHLEDADPLLGEIIAGQYRLAHVLGRGGMGAVYAAVPSSGGPMVALKVIRPDLAEHKGREAIRRFVREAKASQDIDSPYVARILDAGADDARGLPYLAMELLHGRDLGALIKDLGPIEPDCLVPAFVQACEGLEAAHQRGIVHRDIKPANIFLHEAPGGPLVAKVCDFGVAKQLVQVEDNTELTRTGSVLGSPMYMSPEQAQNAKNVDLRSDLWSLGISLYEGLTGQKAWEGSTMGELILAICTRELQPVQEIAPWVKPELAAIVHRATERDPARRFATAAEFAEALRAIAPRSPAVEMRGVSPERRRAAMSARSSSGRFTPSVSENTALAQASAIGVERGEKKARASLVTLGAVGVALAAIGGTLLVTRLSSEPTATVLTSARPGEVAAAGPVSGPIPSSSASALPSPEPTASEPVGAKTEPKAEARPVGVRKPSTPAPPSSVASAASKPPAPAPSFKTTW